MTSPSGKRIGVSVLLSGTGRTLENLLEKARTGELPIDIRLVISDRKDVKGLAIAEAAGLETKTIRPVDYNHVQEEFSKAVTYELESHGTELVVMAGFLSLYKIPPSLENRVMNIHPSLIPSFAGKGYFGDHVHRAALDRGVRITGCTVHFANNEYDAGPIILQKTVEVHDDDTPSTLAARVFEQECEAYPEAIDLFARGRLRIEGTRVRVVDGTEAAHADEVES